jgi:hypothetical protein
MRPSGVAAFRRDQDGPLGSLRLGSLRLGNLRLGNLPLSLRRRERPRAPFEGGGDRSFELGSTSKLQCRAEA